MTTPPTPRDLDAISLLDQAADQLPDGNLRDRICAALALASQATCCVCGGGPVTYRNYREQPFCQPCADPAADEAEFTPRQQYAAQVECAIGLNVDCGGTAGVHKVRDAVLAVRDDELVASQRRAVTFQTRLDAGRDWARRNLTAEQQAGLLEALRGDTDTDLAWTRRMLLEAQAEATAEATRADQVEDLLRIAHDTSNTSEAERARAVQRAEQAAAEVQRLWGLVARVRDYGHSLRAGDFFGLLGVLGDPVDDLRTLTPVHQETVYLKRARASTILQARRWAVRAKQAEAACWMEAGPTGQSALDRILATHTHELAEKIRAEAEHMGADEYGSYQNVLEAADLIDPPKETPDV